MPYPIIDCDVHQGTHDPHHLIAHLPPHFRDRGIKMVNRCEYPNPYGGGRDDAHAQNATALREGYLDKFPHIIPVLSGHMSRVSVLPDLDYAAALARAYNTYVQDYWLAQDPDWLAAITIAPQEPQQAAAEIRERGQDERFVMVEINSATNMPIGNRFHNPIFEACAEMKLPLALHPGGEGTGMAPSPTASGYPSTYLEWHTNLSANYMTQVCSLVCEGVFERWPTFKVIAVEGGLSWAPHLMWRLDKNWKGLRASVPWLQRRPSDIIREHIRFTTQPMEEPDRNSDLHTMLELIQAQDTLLFSSDYPHWDFDDPDWALRRIPQAMHEAVCYGNAATSLRLPPQTLTRLPSTEEQHA